MLVEHVMQRAVSTISPKTPVHEAMQIASRRGVRHLPVVEDGALVGIVADCDLKRVIASPSRS